MIDLRHYVSISGGKDSAAVACLAEERKAKVPGFNPRYLFCDTGNEHPITIDHVGEIGHTLGIEIETLTGYMVPGLMDQAAFDRRRANIQRDWSKEKRSTLHSDECRQRRAAIPPLRKGCRANPARVEALKVWARQCDCPETVWPALPQEIIDLALSVLQGPSGFPYLDMVLLHGLFPSSERQFCTTETKLLPIFHVLGEDWRAGRSTISWVGERASESKRRAAKPPIEREWQESAWAVTYRPIFRWSALDTFAIAKRHGLKPNPLYLMGMGRVGCMPCINAGKMELREIASRFPGEIDRIEAWERLAGLVSRRAATSDLPGGMEMNEHGIREHVEWSKTSRGGRQRDLLFALDAIEHKEAAEGGTLVCTSQYGLCE